MVDYLMARICFREVVDGLVGVECRDCSLPLVGDRDISPPQPQCLDVLKHLFMAAWFAVTCVVRVVQDPEDEVCLDVSMEHGSPEPYLISLRATSARESVSLALVQVRLVSDEDTSLSCEFDMRFVHTWSLQSS